MVKQSWKLIGSGRKQEVLIKQYGLIVCKSWKCEPCHMIEERHAESMQIRSSSFENLVRKWGLLLRDRDRSLVLQTSQAVLMICSRIVSHVCLWSNVFSVTILLQCNSGAFDVESAEGKAATVGYGRPNLKKLITEAVAGLDSSQSVEVIVSGKTIHSALHDLSDWPWLLCHNPPTPLHSTSNLRNSQLHSGTFLKLTNSQIKLERWLRIYHLISLACLMIWSR